MKIKKCRYCAKSFSTAQSLKAHRLSVHDQQHKENKRPMQKVKGNTNKQIKNGRQGERNTEIKTDRTTAIKKYIHNDIMK